MVGSPERAAGTGHPLAMAHTWGYRRNRSDSVGTRLIRDAADGRHVVDDAQAQAAVLGWQRTIDTVHQQLSAPPPKPGIWDGVENGVADVVNGAEDGVARVVNGVASVANALATDPTARAELMGAAGAAGIGLAEEGVGILADATGVGAIGGIPLNAAGAVGLAAAGGLAADAGRRILTDAAQNPVQPMRVDSKRWGEQAREQAKKNTEIAESRANKDGTYRPEDAYDINQANGNIPTNKIPKLFGR